MIRPLRVTTRILDLIGGTPMVRLRHLPGADAGEVWCKCEHWNPGGSVKDRIGRAMIEAAEAEGLIAPDRTTIVEPTSGNTGIGLALVCASRGYKLILTMPESMSLERRALLRSYGAHIELTPAEADMDGAVARAHELVAADPQAWMPDQFRNPANPEVHRRTTAVEILAQLPLDAARGDVAGEPSIDAFVAGIGTGGTITGVGSVLKARAATTRIVGLEPAASAVLSGGKPGLHRIQGIGAGFVPPVLDRDVIDELRTISDEDAWHTAQALARREGLLVGISAGANVKVACDLARELGPGTRVVTILCDTGERYFSMGDSFT
ncbi:MAG: cysteine synthase A [Kofleriaceae bacterium]|nr:cysteine synthase A [Myxococcales bacterium]MCB9563926.1 cysteine synthase A [Kofleriaceae bacterium]